MKEIQLLLSENSQYEKRSWMLPPEKLPIFGGNYRLFRYLRGLIIYLKEDRKYAQEFRNKVTLKQVLINKEECLILSNLNMLNFIFTKFWKWKSVEKWYLFYINSTFS